MAIRKYIQISIVYAEAANLPTLPTEDHAHYLRIRLFESAEGAFASWNISVSQSIMQESTQWTAILSAGESEQLNNMLKQIPAQSMVSEDGVFDGSETEMLIIHKERIVSFRWELPPWEPKPGHNPPPWKQPAWVSPASPNEPETSNESWISVGMLTDFIFQVNEKYRIENSAS